MPGDSRGGPLTTDRPTAENPGEKFTAHGTPIPRQPEGPCAFDYLRRDHADRERQLRKALADAVLRGDEGDQRLVLHRLDELYVGRAFLRAEDREIIRLRRWLRAAA